MLINTKPIKMSYIHITREDRISLAALRKVNTSIADIAKILNKDKSSLYRELGRNKTNNKSGYDVRDAEVLVKERRIKANKRFKKLENNTKLRNQVISKIKIYWSPEEISGRLKLEGINIGKDSIYKYIYTHHQKDLIKYLRYGKKYKYKRRKGTKIREKLREEEKKTRIDKRPNIINTRGRIGDFEGDLIVFGKTKKHPPILTLNERRSGYLKIDILKNKTANVTQEAIVRKLKEVPKKKRLSLTLDNGVEFSYHDMVKRKAKVKVYFAFPYHSWERGSNENLNGLIRQFFPKKMNSNKIKLKDLKHVENLLNNRPRKRLNYLTPKEVFLKN